MTSPKKGRRHADELARFHRKVDLVALARSYGYRVDETATPDAAAARPTDATVLVHRATGDRLIVWRDPDGVWKYSSSADGLYDRTVVEFLISRQRLGMGYVRKTLRWWLRETKRPRLRRR